jgi:predicted DsbA family dithiol-disulfide isomerase
VHAVFRPFQLDPSAPETAEPILARLQRKYGAGAGRMLDQASAAAAAEGLVMRWDRAKSVNTLRAHRLLEWALASGGPEAQKAVAQALFTAHFEEGRDVGDADTLASLAVSAGLDAGDAQAALTSEEGLEATRAEIERALQMGIRSVPTFVFEDRWAVEGAQAPEVLASVMRRVREGTAQDG